MDHFLNAFVFDRELYSGIVTVVSHVVLCSLSSTFLWNWLYHAECDLEFFWSTETSSLSFTTVFFCSLVTIASAVALLIVFSWKRTVVFLIQLAHLCLLVTLPLNIFGDFLNKVPISDSLQLILVFVFVLFYFVIGSFALFTNRLSSQIRRFLVALNCSFISAILLRCFPHQTIWQIMLLDVVWDFFSVFAGPVRKMLENSHNYGEKMVRCVLFSVAYEQSAEKEEATVETSSSSSFLCNAPGEKSAADALGGVQLGLGDFVLFALLVARAWSDHPSGALAALVGIAIGLVANYIVAFSYTRKTVNYFFVPALPCPMLLGMALHFGTLFAIKTFVQTEGMEVLLL